LYLIGASVSENRKAQTRPNKNKQTNKQTTKQTNKNQVKSSQGLTSTQKEKNKNLACQHFLQARRGQWFTHKRSHGFCRRFGQLRTRV
jgi:hypothetical protein